MKKLQQICDLLNTSPGHILIALGLLLFGLLCIVHWPSVSTEGKELFVFAMVVLRGAMVSTGKAADGSSDPTNTGATPPEKKAE